MKINRPLACIATAVFSCTSFAASLVDLSQVDFKQPKSPAFQLEEIKSTTDKMGNTHIRYNQTYQGIPVYGYQVIEHRYQPTAMGSALPLKPFTGTLVEGLDKDLPKQLVAATDPQNTLEKLKAEYSGEQSYAAEALVFENETARTVIFVDDKNVAHMAHEVNFFVDTKEGGKPSRPHYIVDAQTSEVLQQWEGLAHERIGTGPGGNERIGVHYYGDNYPNLDVKKGKRRCKLEGESGKTVHMNNRMANTSGAYAYNCKNSPEQNNDATNGAASPLNDAHFFNDVLTSFYMSRYGQPPLPFPLVMRAHYGKDYANAFWNGTSMTYGDGNAELYPFVVLDIAAHEVSHGVTETNSNLVYKGQSGGMNEAFSDMASRAVEIYTYGSHDWYLGGDIFKDTSVLALRFMDNPPRDGRSIDHVAKYYDGIDVHYSSGIYNKAFYLLANTPNWGTSQAFDVMYYANVYYWEPNSTFASGAWGVVLATASLGGNYYDVINAFAGVGIKCDVNAGKCV